MTKKRTSTDNQLAVVILASFQMLELLLKLYISASYVVIRRSLNGKIPFRHDFSEIKDLSLERLIRLFSRLSSNTDLIDNLRKLCAKRNEVAHRALIYDDDVVRDLLGIDIDIHSSSLLQTKEQVDHCLTLATVEFEKVLSIVRGRSA